MRFVSVPEELTPLALLELGEIPLPLGDRLQEQVRDKVEQGQFEEAQAIADQVFSAAWSGRDRYAAALATLYKADLFRRLQRWEQTLEQTRRALGWLQAQITQAARYNEAVAMYFEGLLHYQLRADDRAMQAFINTQALLVDSERHWGYEGNTERVIDCQNIGRWIRDLLAIYSQIPEKELSVIVPVYELVNDEFIRTQVTVISPFQVMIPSNVLKEYLPPEFIPLEIEELPFLQLQPGVNYFAVKVPKKGLGLKVGSVGDVLIMEMSTPASPAAGINLKEERPFVRRTDGHVIFRPRRMPGGFAGIPRVLIREHKRGNDG